MRKYFGLKPEVFIIGPICLWIDVMEECLFCKIVRNEIQTKKVYEDNHALAFLDINPSSYGHTLVIPKKHYKSLTDMPADEVGRLFETIVTLSGKIKHIVNSDGFNMGINDSPAAGQVIHHVHVHIIPRWKNDGGGAMQSIAHTRIEKEKLDELAAKMKSALSEKEEGPRWSW
jgi:histidine triad (HIT) family protein